MTDSVTETIEEIKKMYPGKNIYTYHFMHGKIKEISLIDGTVINCDENIRINFLKKLFKDKFSI